MCGFSVPPTAAGAAGSKVDFFFQLIQAAMAGLDAAADVLVRCLWPPLGSQQFFVAMGAVAVVSLNCTSPIFVFSLCAMLAGSAAWLLMAEIEGRDASAGGNQRPSPTSEARLVQQMKGAQRAREASLTCFEGDELRVISFADMAQAAFDMSDANWSPSLQTYLGQTGVVEEVDAASVKLRHADGQAVWWAYGAVKISMPASSPAKTAQAVESQQTCAPGDWLQVHYDARAARAAFAVSDARWSLALAGYVGEVGIVERADAGSVLLQHSDGQQLWWPYACVAARSRAPRPIRSCKCGDVLKTVRDVAKARAAFALSDAHFAPVRPVCLYVCVCV